MAISSIGKMVKLDNDTAKIFVEAKKNPQKPTRAPHGIIPKLTDLSLLKNVK